MAHTDLLVQHCQPSLGEPTQPLVHGGQRLLQPVLDRRNLSIGQCMEIPAEQYSKHHIKTCTSVDRVLVQKPSGQIRFLLLSAFDTLHICLLYVLS